MADPKCVKDVMEPALELEANKSVGDAQQKLENGNVPFGVISDTAGKPLTLIKRDQLGNANPDEVLMPTANILHQDPINLDDTLNDIFQTRAKDFVVNRQLSGIVVKKGNTVAGVMLRKAFAESSLLSISSSSAISLSSSDRANVSRLEGSAITPLLLYLCLIDYESQDVAYYNPDPSKRPRCINGHEMYLIREYTR
jgi:hypothetical protein